MKKGWKIAAVGLIILLLFLIFFEGVFVGVVRRSSASVGTMSCGLALKSWTKY